MMALFGFIRLHRLQYAWANTGSFRAATHALSINTLRNGLLLLGVMLPILSFSLDELVNGIRPMKEQSLSRFLNLFMSSNSESRVIETINPIPGILVKYFTFTSLVVVFIGALVLSALFTHWVRTLHRKQSEDYARLLIENLIEWYLGARFE